MDVTVAVCTYGSTEWIDTAQRAIASARDQSTRPSVVHVHGDSLHGARNQALGQARTEWIVYLDADDELEPGYLEHLAAGEADVRAPAVRYVQGSRASTPRVPRVPGHGHDCHGACLPYGNWIVVGAAVRTALVRDVGGWEDWPMYEDWALWLRCYLTGATVEQIPAAVYRAHVRPDSRNRAPSMAEKNRVHHAIADAILPRMAA